MVKAARLGADRVELYTEPYARAFGTTAQAACCAATSSRRARLKPEAWA